MKKSVLVFGGMFVAIMLIATFLKIGDEYVPSDMPVNHDW